MLPDQERAALQAHATKVEQWESEREQAYSAVLIPNEDAKRSYRDAQLVEWKKQNPWEDYTPGTRAKRIGKPPEDKYTESDWESDGEMFAESRLQSWLVDFGVGQKNNGLTQISHHNPMTRRQKCWLTSTRFFLFCAFVRNMEPIFRGRFRRNNCRANIANYGKDNQA